MFTHIQLTNSLSSEYNYDNFIFAANHMFAMLQIMKKFQATTHHSQQGQYT